jgi:hypothetical protein
LHRSKSAQRVTLRLFRSLCALPCNEIQFHPEDTNWHSEHHLWCSVGNDTHFQDEVVYTNNLILNLPHKVSYEVGMACGESSSFDLFEGVSLDGVDVG